MGRNIRRRKQKQVWRWVGYLTLYVLMAGSTVGFVTWAREYVLTDSRFAIERVRVLGCAPHTAQELVDRLDWTRGCNVFRCDLDRVRRDVLAHRWVDEAVVRRSLPDALRVEIQEEVPAGLVLLRRRVYVVSRTGETICPVDEYDRDLDLPVLIGLDGQENRGQAIRRGLSFLDEIKRTSLLFWGNLETLDVSDPDNAVARLTHGGAPVNLGHRLIPENVLNYLSIADYVQQRYSDSVYIELGFPGQVAVMPGPTENPN